MCTQTTAIIRDRWQLTIPDEIRKVLTWIQPGSVILLEVNAKKEIIIKPYIQYRFSNTRKRKLQDSK